LKFGSIPAGGEGTRMQPLGFSKELLPVDGKAVIEHLIERMVLAGVDKIFVNISSNKSDIVQYISEKSPYADNCIFMVRERKGLLDGVVQPRPFLRGGNRLYFGLPDTIWFPKDGFQRIDADSSDVSLGLFDSGTPEKFDAVYANKDGVVHSIVVKHPEPTTKWTWGIGSMAVDMIDTLLTIAEKIPSENVLMGEVLDRFAKDHRVVSTKIAKSSYIDIGEPKQFRKVEDFVQSYSDKA
jgi:dTDP-glucose pyrophosphorylase